MLGREAVHTLAAQSGQISAAPHRYTDPERTDPEVLALHPGEEAHSNRAAVPRVRVGRANPHHQSACNSCTMEMAPLSSFLTSRHWRRMRRRNTRAIRTGPGEMARAIRASDQSIRAMT